MRRGSPGWPVMVSGLALSAALGSCAATSPFVDLGPLTDAEVERVLRERTEHVRSLTGELVIAYDGAELAGTFDAVAHFQRPCSMRMTAFKDVVIAVEPVFDLALTAERYGFEVSDPDGGEPTTERGAARDLPVRQPRFAGFFWGREAFCLPGALAPDQVVVVRQEQGADTVVESRLSSGAHVTWRLDRSTLEVRSAAVRTAEGPVGSFSYGSYVAVGGAFVPSRVVYEDAARTTRIEAHVGEIEINPALNSALFDVGQVGLPRS